MVEFEAGDRSLFHITIPVSSWRNITQCYFVLDLNVIFLSSPIPS